MPLVRGGDGRRLGDRGPPLQGEQAEDEDAEEDEHPQRRQLRQEEARPEAPPPGERGPGAEQDPDPGQQEIQRAGHREALARAASARDTSATTATTTAGSATRKRRERRPSRSGSAKTASRPSGAKRRTCRPIQTKSPLATARIPAPGAQVEQRRPAEQAGGGCLRSAVPSRAV